MKESEMMSTWVKLWTLVQEPQDFLQLVFIQPAFVLHSPVFDHFVHRSCVTQTPFLGW